MRLFRRFFKEFGLESAIRNSVYLSEKYVSKFNIGKKGSIFDRWLDEFEDEKNIYHGLDHGFIIDKTWCILYDLSRDSDVRDSIFKLSPKDMEFFGSHMCGLILSCMLIRDVFVPLYNCKDALRTEAHLLFHDLIDCVDEIESDVLKQHIKSIAESVDLSDEARKYLKKCKILS